jgi:hypothetical protein
MNNAHITRKPRLCIAILFILALAHAKSSDSQPVVAKVACIDSNENPPLTSYGIRLSENATGPIDIVINEQVYSVSMRNPFFIDITQNTSVYLGSVSNGTFLFVLQYFTTGYDQCTLEKLLSESRSEFREVEFMSFTWLLYVSVPLLLWVLASVFVCVLLVVWCRKKSKRSAIEKEKIRLDLERYKSGLVQYNAKRRFFY